MFYISYYSLTFDINVLPNTYHQIKKNIPEYVINLIKENITRNYFNTSLTWTSVLPKCVDTQLTSRADVDRVVKTFVYIVPTQRPAPARPTTARPSCVVTVSCVVMGTAAGLRAVLAIGSRGACWEVVIFYILIFCCGGGMYVCVCGGGGGGK